MEKYFATYNQSLALKELGFDEPCFAGYRDSEWIGTDGPNSRYFHAQLFSNHQFDDDQKKYCSAPLKSQVFEWFRKYKLSVVIHDLRDDYEANIIEWTLDDDKISYGFLQLFETYEEAESACIDKLIEMCHDK